MLYCTECGKTIGILESFRHPIESREKIVCSICWDVLEDSEIKYSNFILNCVNSKNGFICFVLLKVKPSFEVDAYKKLKKLSKITEIYPLLGSYDFIIKIISENSDDLGNYIVNNIRNINGIASTKTLTGGFSLTNKDF